LLFFEVILAAVLLLLPAWRIFGRAGYRPALSLIVLIPFVGALAALAVLAFGDWPVGGGPRGRGTMPPGPDG
jgi:hypothetical protein